MVVNEDKSVENDDESPSDTVPGTCRAVPGLGQASVRTRSQCRNVQASARAQYHGRGGQGMVTGQTGQTNRTDTTLILFTHYDGTMT